MIKKLEKSHQLLHSYCVRPDVHFGTQDDDEEILLLLRAHPIITLSWVINGLILLIILIVVNIVFQNSLTFPQLIMINFISVAMILSYYWFNLLSYLFNVCIITNKRIIDVDYHAVLYREVCETQYNKIEDVTSRSSGYFASLFDFGDIYIQTAGTNANIELLKTPKSVEVENIINDLIRG